MALTAPIFHNLLTISVMQKFVPLHVHSQYSVLDGLASIPAMVKKAADDGMGAMALTDHGNMFGIKELCTTVKKHNGKVKKQIADAEKALAEAQAAGDADAITAAEAALAKARSRYVKPIIGCEMYLTSGDLHDRDPKHRRYHLVVLAKNMKGYKNLIRLVSQAWTEGFYTRPRTDKASLAAHREGLIISSACIGGELPQLLRAGDYEGAERAAAWWKETFGDDFYIELQRHKATSPNANHETYQIQREIEPQLIAIARKLGIKIIATNDSHFVNERDGEAHDRLICLSTNKSLDDPTRMRYSMQEWFKTSGEMAQVFADLPEALENTLEIAAKVEEYSIDHAPIMPTFAIPAEFGSEEEYRSRITEQELFDEFTRDENGNIVLSQEDAEAKIKKLGGYEKLYRIKFEADYLAKIAYEGAARRYGTPLSPEIDERIRFELHIMKTMGFPGYFLIVEDFIRVGRQMGVSIGPGRGSAAGSVVAYCLGITQVDPIRYDLLFERFLNPDRISLPDIDVDFDDDGRETVLNYVTERYGAPNVAHIITYGTMAAKSAIKDVARIEQLPLSESNRLTKLIPKHMPEVNGKELKPTLKNCYEHVPEFQAELKSHNPLIIETLRYAKELEGNVRNTGVHACGVIIGRDDITDWVPVSTATDKDGSKQLVTQYEGSVIEDTGLIKMDFLGLKTLSIIKEAIANIKQTRGIDVDIDTVPIDDKKTYELYCAGKTTGTFQFESAGMQKYLRELQPTVFEDLIAMNALYRPGPMDYIPDFIARKHGKSPIVYDIPIMEQYLKDTYGVTVYQEQVMLLSRLLANFTRGESDTLRKAMGKKLIDKMNALKAKFLEGGQANGHKKEVLEKIWADWEKFASYAFNKSHATCYSWVAFQTAYLKANYPAEYMAAVLSRNLADITKLTNFMDECKSMKIDVLGPDVNESFSAFGVNKDGNIRFGLAAIKGIGVNVVNEIIRARNEGGTFTDIYDFVERVDRSAINRRTLENLANAGAFDCFTDIKREDYFEQNNKGETLAELLVRYGQNFQNDKSKNENSLFGDFDDNLTVAGRPPVKPAPELPLAVKLEKEKELVGMYLSANPLDPYYVELQYGCTTLKDFSSEEDIALGKEITLGGMVTEFAVKQGKKGPFGIMKIEDYSSAAEFMMFGNDFLSFQKFGVPGTIVRIIGKYENIYDRVRFKIINISLMEDVKRDLVSRITIDVSADRLNENLHKVIKDYVKSKVDDGKQLYFRVREPELNRSVRLGASVMVSLERKFLKALSDMNLEYDIV